MKYYLQRPDGSFSDAADYPGKPADRPEGTWKEGEPSSQPYKETDLGETLTAIISQGQQTLSGDNALPDDIQESIYELELKCLHLAKRNPKLIIKHIEGFEIPEDRDDVTPEQRALVEQLKGVMLGVLQG